MPPRGNQRAAPRASGDDENRRVAEGVDDIYDEDYKKSLRIECRELEKQIKTEEKITGLFMDERLRINYFWLIAKKELEDKQAELRNKQRECQDLSEKHEIEKKIYKQRVKHLMFQNLDQLTELKKEAQITLKNIEDENRINERELKQDLRSLKISKKEQEVRHHEYVNALTKEKNKQQTKLRQDFERISNEIHQKFKNKMQNLRKEMEDKRKAKIKMIQDQKDQDIAELTQKHAKKYQDIKGYYVEITNTNLDIIKQLQEELNDARKEDIDKNKQKNDQTEQNSKVVQPLAEANDDVLRLTKQKEKHEEIKAALDETQQQILHYDETSKDIEWHYEVRLQQFQYLKKEKDALFEEFNRITHEIHQKTGLRNLILEKKHETIQESLETKDAQINQLLAAARIDPQALGVIRSTLEEVENLKSDAIREIQASLKKIREAHSNMVKTYEGKLSEFGIPVEELGFDPLVPANI